MSARRAMDTLARSKRLSAAPRINVTPLIDVVMVLIVFFLMVGHLVTERRGAVDLPESRTGAPESRDPARLIVLVREGGAILLEGKPIEREALARALSRALAERVGAGSTVQVRAGRDLPFAAIRPVLEACREAGAESVELAAASPARGGRQ